MDDSIREQYNTSDELIKAMTEEQRRHSERVSKYMEELFLQACAADLYKEDAKAQTRLKEENRALAADIGRLHDIGKILVPETYQKMSEKFSPEELALYRKHVKDSAELADVFLTKEKSYKSVELRYLNEAILSHHERWDGEGFPNAIAGKDIPVLARLLAIADRLDNLAAGVRSEHPFEFAIERIAADAGKAFDPAIVKLLLASKVKLKKIFTAYISQTKAVPTVRTLVKHNAGRPFCLVYRPIIERKNGAAVAYEAAMRFKNKQDYQPYAEIEELLKKEDLTGDLGAYFTVEACDVINRLDACAIPAEYILMEYPAGWFNRRSAAKEIESALKDTRVEPKRLCINLPFAVYASISKTAKENLTKIRALGCSIMVSDADPSAFLEDETFVNLLRMGPDMEDKLAEESLLKQATELRSKGMSLLTDGIEKKRSQSYLTSLGVQRCTGLIFGDYVGEEELIERELAAQGC